MIPQLRVMARKISKSQKMRLLHDVKYLAVFRHQIRIKGRRGLWGQGRGQGQGQGQGRGQGQGLVIAAGVIFGLADASCIY